MIGAEMEFISFFIKDVYSKMMYFATTYKWKWGLQEIFFFSVAVMKLQVLSAVVKFAVLWKNSIRFVLK